MRALVVDDDRSVRDVLAATLQRIGYDTLKASSVSEALTLVRQTAFDAAVIDIELDGESGLDVISHCLELLPDSTIVAVSGNPQWRQAALDSGASAFLIKPFGRGELIEALGATRPD